MKKNVYFSLIYLLSFTFMIMSCGSEGYNAKTDKSAYTPGETIKVDYTADANWDKSAWIGIIPSDVAHGKEAENDANDIAYKYLKKSAKGTLEFTAPNEPGNYDIRMHDTDDGSKGLEISSVSFTVK